MNSSNLHTILDLPSGVFVGAGVKTVVLFFDKGSRTKRIWYYQLNLGRNLGKTTPLSEKDLEDFVQLQKTKGDSDNSWTVDIGDIAPDTFDLSVKNPHDGPGPQLREPEEILEEMKILDRDSTRILEDIYMQIHEK